MRLLIVALSVLGCLLPYLASARQKLTVKPLPRLAAWVGFCVLEVAAAALLAMLYGPLAAFLMTVVLVMCIWPALVFGSAHFQTRPVLVTLAIVATLSLVMLTEMN